MARRVLIIGNSDGIGLAITKSLLGRGDEVVGVSRSPTPVSANEFHHEVMDVTDPAYPALLERLVSDVGPFDACIYCAGIASPFTVPDLSGEAKVFDVNLTAMVRTLEHLTASWVPRGKGHFIGLSSLADILVNPDHPSYSASKAGVSRYLTSMALRLRHEGVAVTNVRFGFVDTKMAKAVLRRPLMMSAESAALRVICCLDTRPVQISVPRTVALFVGLARVVQTIKIWKT